MADPMRDPLHVTPLACAMDALDVPALWASAPSSIPGLTCGQAAWRKAQLRAARRRYVARAAVIAPETEEGDHLDPCPLTPENDL